MKKIEIEGEAKIKFFQTFEVTDEEFEILNNDWGVEVDQILDYKLDLDCINEISDFYVDNLVEVND